MHYESALSQTKNQHFILVQAMAEYIGSVMDVRRMLQLLRYYDAYTILKAIKLVGRKRLVDPYSYLFAVCRRLTEVSEPVIAPALPDNTAKLRNPFDGIAAQ